MTFGSLERKLGLPCGHVSAVVKLGVKGQYNQFAVSPKSQLIRRRAKIPKKRTIFAPMDQLKVIQRAIARVISSKFSPHQIAHAYADGRSIFTNARQHVGARSILKIDLVDFFGSISRGMVIDALRSRLDGFSDEDIGAIADLCCYEGFLPQGSPASPILSNLVCYPLDVDLDELACRNGCVVTRYSDDITFSTSAQAFPTALAAIVRQGRAHKIALARPIYSLLQSRGLSINPRKLKFQTRPGLLKITGLVVGDGVSVPREFCDNVRAGLHQWERYGLHVCAQIYSRGCILAFANSMRGSIEYIGQARGRECNRYQRALAEFGRLKVRDNTALMAAAQTAKS